jgi:hypothetical protein
MLAPQKGSQDAKGPVRQRARAWLRANALALVTLGLFLATVCGQVASGLAAHNQELSERAQAPLSLAAYLTSGHFMEALFENWESEFLQMGLFVWLSARLRQRGSAESKPLDEGFEAMKTRASTATTRAPHGLCAAAVGSCGCTSVRWCWCF